MVTTILKYILFIIFILALLMNVGDYLNGQFKGIGLIEGFLAGVLFIGIQRKKVWLPYAIIATRILSYILIIVPIPTVYPIDSTVWVVRILSIPIDVFLIYFFSRKEVRQYFSK